MKSTGCFGNVSHGDLVEKRYNECRCIGRPNRFVRGECFTCGRFLPGLAGRLNADERREQDRAALGALLLAVHRQQNAMRLAAPAPRRGRRVVIEPEPSKAPAGRKRHGGRRTAPRSAELRDVEQLTRTF